MASAPNAKRMDYYVPQLVGNAKDCVQMEA